MTTPVQLAPLTPSESLQKVHPSKPLIKKRRLLDAQPQTNSPSSYSSSLPKVTNSSNVSLLPREIALRIFSLLPPEEAIQANTIFLGNFAAFSAERPVLIDYAKSLGFQVDASQAIPELKAQASTFLNEIKKECLQLLQAGVISPREEPTSSTQEPNQQNWSAALQQLKLLKTKELFQLLGNDSIYKTPKILNYLHHIQEYFQQEGSEEDESKGVIKALDHNNLQALKLLMDVKANIHLVNAQGMTPLLAACANGDLHFAEKLLNLKADSRAVLKDGSGCPELAVQSRNVVLADFILKHCGISKVEHLQPLMDIAIAKEDREMIDLLYKKGAPLTPLHVTLAAKNKQFDTCIYLIEKYQLSSLTADSEGNLPIQYASMFGSVDHIKKLIQQPGLDVNVRRANGSTLLMSIVERKDIDESAKVECVTLLLSLAANPNLSLNVPINGFEMTPLRASLRSGETKVSQLLLTIPPLNPTPLILSVFWNVKNTELLATLKKYGADINARWINRNIIYYLFENIVTSAEDKLVLFKEYLNLGGVPEIINYNFEGHPTAKSILSVLYSERIAFPKITEFLFNDLKTNRRFSLKPSDDPHFLITSLLNSCRSAASHEFLLDLIKTTPQTDSQIYDSISSLLQNSSVDIPIGQNVELLKALLAKPYSPRCEGTHTRPPLLVVAIKDSRKGYKQVFTKILLENGANPDLKTKKNVSARSLSKKMPWLNKLLDKIATQKPSEPQVAPVGKGKEPDEAEEAVDTNEASFPMALDDDPNWITNEQSSLSVEEDKPSPNPVDWLANFEWDF